CECNLTLEEVRMPRAQLSILASILGVLATYPAIGDEPVTSDSVLSTRGTSESTFGGIRRNSNSASVERGSRSAEGSPNTPPQRNRARPTAEPGVSGTARAEKTTQRRTAIPPPRRWSPAGNVQRKPFADEAVNRVQSQPGAMDLQMRPLPDMNSG